MMGKCGVHTMRKMVIMVMVMLMMKSADGVDTNPVLSPCDDAKINRWDGFTFGLAFSSKEAFFLNENQLSPCDSRLALATKNAQLALFRPKVDEISLLTIDSTAFNPVYITFMLWIYVNILVDACLIKWKSYISPLLHNVILCMI